MTTAQAPRSQHRSGAGPRSLQALSAALRALRHVQDEQMRMWEGFYKASTWDTRPQLHDPDRAPAPAGSDSGPAAAGAARAA